MAKPGREPSKNLGSQPLSYSCLFCLCKLTKKLGYTLFLYHWSALRPLASCPRQPWKAQTNEWLNWQKFRCEMSGLPGDAKQVSEQAASRRAGLQQVRSHQRHRLGVCWYSGSHKLQSSMRKGTKSRKSSDCNTQHSPKGVQRRVTWAIRGTKGPTSDMIQESKYFSLARQWLRKGYTATEQFWITQYKVLLIIGLEGGYDTINSSQEAF